MRAGISLLVTFGLAACSYHVDKAPGGTDQIPSFSRDQLSYAIVYQYVFQPKCVRCHGGQSGLFVDNFSSVKQYLALIERDALQTHSMPKAPDTPLSPDQARLLRDWIDIGAPELAGMGNQPPPPPPVLEPKFASIHDAIFRNHGCLNCHNASGSAHDVPLDTIADLLDSPDDLVIPGDPEGSYLTIVVSPGARRPMPPLNSNLAPLSPDEINVIKEWIKNGAKD